MSTKKDRMRGQILTHGFNLARIFNVCTSYDPAQIPEEPATVCFKCGKLRYHHGGPVALAKQVHRIEVRAHRLAEEYCNGIIDETQDAKNEASILKALDNILNFKAQGIPVFVNGDPRGYALKIADEYVKAHNLEIHRDWGGYGILAPEFDGSN
jgi:hypothetical protein